MSPAPDKIVRSASAPVRPLVIVGDVHLTRADVGGALMGALSGVVDDSAGHDVVFAGDLLDLPLDSSREHEDPERAVALIAADARLRGALGRHVDRGNVVTLVAGNHDACIARASVIEALRDAIGLEGAARERLRATPWFTRVGPVHIEHGHAHDPDNAPSHPLAEPLDGLGTFIVRNLIRPTGATAFLGQSDGTPMTQLWRAFRIYGVRGPGIVARYFATAFSALFMSGPRWRARADRLARGDLLAFARDVGLDAETIELLAALGAHPTFASIHRTFTRLYFDRVGLTVAAAVGAGAALAGQPAVGLMTMTTASVLLAATIMGSPNRYAERAVEGLREAADRTADATGASLVVYGHVHREDAGERYANTSSFGCAPEARRGDGHPYLRVSVDDDRPRVERMLARSCERMLATR